MADIDTGGGGGKKGKKVRGKKMSTRVDFTPMVDLGFLLITFFMLTTSMNKPQTMEINMPVKDENLTDDEKTKIKASQAMTILLTKDNKVVYYFVDAKTGEPGTPLVTNFGKGGVRATLLKENRMRNDRVDSIAIYKEQLQSNKIKEEEFREKVGAIKAYKDGLIVVIKANDDSKYKNLVDILDEMNICNIGRYAIVDITPMEVEMLKNTPLQSIVIQNMAGKIDLYDSKWIDLVFRGRNQEYGAYEIRRLYPRNAFLGIVLSIVLFTLAVSAPLIIKLISDAIPEEKVVLVNNTTDLEEPPPVDKNQPATPPPPPPPPLKSTIKFTPPEIKPDAEVPDEPPPTQDKLQDVDAGKTTVEGDPNADVDLSGLEDGTGDVIGEEQVFLAVEQQPEFPGGESALIEYIGKNTKYPAIARENNIEGRVFISFVVEKDGNISDVKVVRGIGGGCDEEAKRVIKGLPRFTPGKQNGRPVRVQYNVPVNFKLM